MPTPALNQVQKTSASSAFCSILFGESRAGEQNEAQQAPDCFGDLNLDQTVASVTAGRDEYNLKLFFYTPLHSVDAISYRQDIFRDMENHVLFGHVQSFAHEMRTMRSHLAQAKDLYYKLQRDGWFLDAVDVYCGAVRQLSHELTRADLHSSGLRDFCEYLRSYIDSDDFIALNTETQSVKAALNKIRYCLHIQGKRIKVSRYNSEPDYGADVLRSFDKFKQGAPKEYRFSFLRKPEMNHVEAAILDRVAELFPEVFSSLADYCVQHSGYLDNTIARFDREVQFYTAYLEHIAPLKKAGLVFCYPTVTDRSKEIYGREVFDLALANRLVRDSTPVVTNDFYLRGPERIFIVSGPNQGGKTTFARTFGQLHYLACIGCPVPGSEARVFLFDKLFTHFEREEKIQNLSGKLEDDLIRIHRVLQQATSNSVLIMNESFLSTTLSDALFLSKEILQRVIERSMLCVSVTFLDELALLSTATVSMVSTVNPDDPAVRTFKLVRKPADGLAYAFALAERYRLTYEQIKTRIGRTQ